MGIIPNIITCIRIFGTLSLFFIKPLSVAFFVVYTISGVSDVLDGFIARTFHVESPLGTKLDSIADMFFYCVMLVKIFPVLFTILPTWIWIVVGAIIFTRICSYTLAAVKYRKFASLHTYLNKLTGISIFIVPYFLKRSFAPAICFAVCVIASIATIEELAIHITAAKYNENTKTIFFKHA